MKKITPVGIERQSGGLHFTAVDGVFGKSRVFPFSAIRLICVNELSTHSSKSTQGTPRKQRKNTMIEVLPDSKGNILILRAEGRLTHQDYKNVIIPRLEAMIRDHGRVRFLLDNFDGWQPAALWGDARFGLIHRNDFEKIGLIGGPTWVGWGLKLVALVMSAEMRTFSPSERSKALSWIQT